MDVLQLIKSRNEDLRSKLRAWNDEAKGSVKQRLESLESILNPHLKLEEEFLFPEIEGLFPRSDAVVATGTTNHRSIAAILGQLTGRIGERKLTESSQQISDIVSQHVGMIEDIVMPAIRRAVPTPQREELGAVYKDLASEILSNSGSSESNRSRKRA